MHICMFVFACVCEHVCMLVCTGIQKPEVNVSCLFQSSSTSMLKQGLSVELRARDHLVCLWLRMRGSSHICSDFTWALVIQTPVLKIVFQGLYPTSHLPSPTLFKKKKCWRSQTKPCLFQKFCPGPSHSGAF